MQQDQTQDIMAGLMGLGQFNTLKQIARGRKSRKGIADRHVVRRFVKDDREYYLHATKGWRARRV
jgi:hypothetical protein